MSSNKPSNSNTPSNQASHEVINKKYVNSIIAGFLTFILVLGVLYIATIDKPIGQEYKPVYEYGGDFTLRTVSQDISLVDYRDKVVVVYFGFLNCSEACPTSMGTITKAISQLTPKERDTLQVLFLSVDPDRDSLDALDRFSQFYKKRYQNEKNPEMLLAITGSNEEIKTVSDQYGVYFDFVDLEGSALGYTVDHSSRFYMIGTDGKLVTTMNHSTTPIELAARIRQLQEVVVSQNNDKTIGNTQTTSADTQ